MQPALGTRVLRAAGFPACLRPAIASSSSSSWPLQGAAAASPTPARRDVRAFAKQRAGAKARPKKAPTVDVLPAWAAPLQIVRYPDPRLRALNAKIAVFDDGLAALAAAMMDVMYDDDGIGLAAPQVGLNLRLMVFNLTAKRGDEAETVLVNPELVSRSSATWRDQEGCLSFPQLYADIERHERVEVRYQDLSGAERGMSLSGWEAKLFQHEFDHLQGVLFLDRMRAADVERLRPELKALEDAYAAARPAGGEGDEEEFERLPPPKKPAGAKGFGGFGSKG